MAFSADINNRLNGDPNGGAIHQQRLRNYQKHLFMNPPKTLADAFERPRALEFFLFEERAFTSN